jgi:hypothetical protein
VLLPAALAGPALAATPPPQSGGLCYGALAGAPTADQPNLMNYQFKCDRRITAYTIIANRRPRDFDVIDNFSTTADVLDPSGNIVPTQSFLCEGDLPGDGFNCNTGTFGSYAGALSTIKGTLSLTDPYCKTLAANAVPGTYATPQATVQLVVTDVTGAQDGPFRLTPAGACPAVRDRVPFPTKKTKKTKTRHKSSGHKARA